MIRSISFVLLASCSLGLQASNSGSTLEAELSNSRTAQQFTSRITLIGEAAQAPVENRQPLLYVDVRSWAENQYDRIEGDIHIHYTNIAEEISLHASSKDQAINVYCAVGGRAETARQALISAGFSNVTNLGGIEDARKLDRVEN